MFRFFTLLALYAGLLACSESIPQISVQTELAGKEIQTTVDSDIARYYLEQFLKGDKTRPEYDRAIETAERNIVGELPSKALLQLLAQTHSTDFATLILWQSIVRNPSNRWPQKVFTEEFSRLKTNTGRDAARFLSAQHDYLIVFAPGWFYKSQPESGADFAKPRQVLTNVGARTRLLETEENGTVERNADLIAEQLIRFGRDAKKLIVVSASKAGPEVAFALTKLQQDTSAVHHVKAWVNIGGVLRGSTLADRALTWPTSWLVKLFILGGQSSEGIESLSTQISVERASRTVLPAHMTVLNYTGIPLSGQVSERARTGYSLLREEGPNDGLTPIVDEIPTGSITVAELGLDHFFRDPLIDMKTVALTNTILRLVEGESESP
jgi:hypothetical protein